MIDINIQRDPKFYIETYSGIKFYPLQPRANEINIIDMVHASSGESRYGAHTEITWSVAQHSLAVYQLLKDWGYDSYIQFLGLTHDFEESYLKDIPKPIKEQFPEYKAAGKFLQDMIWCEYFGIRKPTIGDLTILKAADAEILNVEAIALNINKTRWVNFNDSLAPLGLIDFEDRPRGEVKEVLMARLLHLMKELNIEKLMGYVIQNIANGEYLKHNGSDQSSDDPYDEVKNLRDAEFFSTFDHACCAAFWYADHSKKWRIIDTETNLTFVHDQGGRFKRENEPQ